MDDPLLIKTRAGKFVKFSSQNNAQIFGAFWELICKDAGVIYSGIDSSKAWKMLEKKNPFLIDFKESPNGKHYIIIGPYGLNGGGVCCGSQKIMPNLKKISELAITNIRNENYSSLDQKQRDLQREIQDSLSNLLKGAEGGFIENIKSSLKKLGNIPLGYYGNPCSSAKLLLGCLYEENIWNKQWIFIRREISNMAKKLLFFAFHQSRDRANFYKTNKDEFSNFAESIENKILNKEKEFPENGLLADIKAIKSAIKLIKTEERWYSKLYVHGKHLVDCLLKKDLDSGLELLKDIWNCSRDAIRSDLPLNSLIFDYLSDLLKTDINAYYELHGCLKYYKDSNWELLYIILDKIEAVILDKGTDEAIRKKFLEGNNDEDKKYPGFLEFAEFHSYHLSDNWRIREKIASGLAKISTCDITSFQETARAVIDERIQKESDKRVKNILLHPENVQDAQKILEETWDIRREPIEELLIAFQDLKENQAENFNSLMVKINNLSSILGNIREQDGESFEFVKNQIIKCRTEIDKRYCILALKSSINGIGYLSNISQIKQCQNYQRRQEIAKIERKIPENKLRFLIQIAIVGKEGAGKSEMAKEFVNKIQGKFGVIWWFEEALKESQIVDGYMKIAEALGIISPSLYKDEVIRQIMLALARQKRPWLFIFDGAEDPELIKEFTPNCRGVALVTSRNSNWINALNIESYAQYRLSRGLRLVSSMK